MACAWTEIVEQYWSVCWAWIIPYPCRKSRTVRRWCCDFAWIKESRWGFFCTLEGCAGGQRYTWSAFCFNLFGTVTFYNIRKCFTSQRTPAGSCG